MAGISIASHMSEYASGWLPRIGVAAYDHSPDDGTDEHSQVEPREGGVACGATARRGHGGQRGGLEQRTAAPNPAEPESRR